MGFKKIFDCIVLGSGPAGLTAALYMCRSGFKTCIVMGQQHYGSLGRISLIQNFPGFKQISGFVLGQKMQEQLFPFIGKNLTKIDYTDAICFVKRNPTKTVKVPHIQVALDNGTVILAKTVIQAIGGVHKVLGLQGEQKYYGNGISFCATCDGPLFNDCVVTVIGGGNSAIDAAINLANYCKKVIIIHRRDTLRAENYMVDKVSQLTNVQIKYNTIVSSINGDKDGLKGITVVNTQTNQSYDIQCSGCFYALGFCGYDIHDDSQITDQLKSINNVFSAGDCIDIKYRQVITACGDGCKAALDCIKYLQFE